MKKTKRRYLEYFISCILIAAITITGISVPESRVKADTTNPIDTGRGYEYSNGKAIGKYFRIQEWSLTTIDTDTLKIIADEYNLKTTVDLEYSSVYGGYEYSSLDKGNTRESLRYPEGYLWNEVYIKTGDSDIYNDDNDFIGYNGFQRFYVITNKNYVVMDYGRIITTRYSGFSYYTPYGSSQTFNYWGYDKNGYDVTGYGEDGYDRDGYDRDGYDRDGYDKDGYNKDGYNSDGYKKDGYNKDGYDKDGYKRNGYDKDGYDRDGYDRDGYDKNGNYNQYDKTKDDYGKDGYNGYGYDKDGYNRLGINKDGYNKKGEKAKSKVDTGEGFEYNITGGGCGINVNNATGEFCEIVSREYNITYNKNDSKSLNDIYTSEMFKSIRYPEGYKYKYLKIDNTYIYCLTNSSGKVYDYGKIDVSDQSDISSVAANLPSTPLGGKEAYDYYGCSKDGYNKNGLDYQGFGRDGYNKKNRNKNGYDKKGYLYTEEKTSSERAVPTDFTTITESYKKKLRSEWEDGYFYDENGVYNYDKIDDFDYLKWYDDGRLAGATERYYDDGETVIDIGEMEFYKWGNGIFNFNLPNKDKIRKSYSGYTDMLSIEKQKVGYIKDKKTELKEENCIKSYTLYITPAKSCRLYTGKYIKEKNVKKFKFLNKGKSYKITGSYKDVIVLANDTGELERKFSYKLVPSTKNVSNLKMSAYKGKMISADKTSIKVKAKSSVNDDIYLANINAEDIKVTSSNKAIVKVSKKNKAGNIYCTLKLTGGSKKGKATVTIKDKNSGKKQKITVTNSK